MAGRGEAGKLPFKLDSTYGWLSLRGANDVEIDEVQWFNQKADVSGGLSLDGGAAYGSFSPATIGRSNSDSMADLVDIRDQLRIVEIHYEAAEGTTYEFIKLQNIGATPIALGDVRFSGGVDFEFPTMSLAPGDCVIVASDQVQYETFHGEQTPVAGSYAGKLSNSGEALRLETESYGYFLLEFTYDDAWYPTTDGGGDRLRVVNVNAPI
ncbi:MAG: hypothetical protein ACKVHP_00305 [Verrucomicrobiales bacterium]